MQILRDVVVALRGSLQTRDKIENYSALRDILDNLYVTGHRIDEETFLEILDCVNEHLVDNSTDIKKVAVIVLDLIFKIKGEDFILEDIPEYYLHLAFDEADKYSEVVQPAYNCVKSLVADLCQREMCNFEDLATRISDEETFLKLMEEVFKNLPSGTAVKTLYFNVIPATFNTAVRQVENALLDLSFELIKLVPIALLTNVQLKNFKSSAMKSYVPKIEGMRFEKNPDWLKFWSFLIRCFGVELHTQLDLMNSLLKIVETSFRSQLLSEREIAYDCWMEVIDNYSLDISYMCSAKQMRLILTPLHSNASRNEVLLLKKFETWVHLIKKLEGRNTSVILPFLNFCYGPFSDPLMGLGLKALKSASQGRRVPKICKESTYVLIEMFGHQDSCFGNFSILDLPEPIINSHNINELVTTIIDSVTECSLLMLNSFEFESIPAMAKCLWRNFLRTVSNITDSTDRERFLINTGKQICALYKAAFDRRDILEYILKPVIQVLLVHDISNDESIWTKNLILPSIKEFLGHKISNGCFELIRDIIQIGAVEPHKRSLFSHCFEFLQNENCKSIHNVVDVWEILSSVLLQILTDSVIVSDVVDECLTFLSFLLPYMRCLEREHRKRLMVQWNKIFLIIDREFPTQGPKFVAKLKEYSKVENHLTNETVFFSELEYFLIDEKIDGDLKSELTSVLAKVVSLPNLSKSSVEKATFITGKLIENVAKDSNMQTVGVYNDLTRCTKCLINLKAFSLLKPIQEHLQSLPNDFQEKLKIIIFEETRNLSGGIAINNSSDVQKLYLKLTSTPKNDTNFQIPAFSRSAKIANMGKTLTHKNRGNETVRLFGRDLDTMAPVALKGSLLGSAPKLGPAKKLKPKLLSKPPPVIDDNDSASFVLIHSEVKPNIDKLSEHQIEVLKEKRSDIPALYQDLSQSQTGSSSQEAFKKLGIKGNTEGQEQKENKLPAVVEKWMEKSEQVEVIEASDQELHADEADKEQSATTNEEANSVPVNKMDKKLMRLLSQIEMNVVGGDEVLKSLSEPRKQRKARPKVVENIVELPPRKRRSKSCACSDTECNSTTKKKNKRLSKKEAETLATGTSQDLIESSQESYVDIAPLPSLENTPNLPTECADVPDTSLEQCRVNLFDSEKIEESQRSKLLQHEFTLSPNELMDADLRNNDVELKSTCDLDTQTLSPVGDEIQIGDIPGSPINATTPTRNSEFIINTVDISPIKTPSTNKASEPGDSSQEKILSKGVSQYEIPSCSKAEYNEQENENEKPSGSRFGKFVKLHAEKNKPKINLIAVKRVGSVSSPKTARVMKMIKSCENEAGLTNDPKENPASKAQNKYLEFTRQLPSPLASPKFGILKRKMTESTDDPNPKRFKRVNFSDPPLTCETLFMKDDTIDPEENDEEGIKIVEVTDDVCKEQEGETDQPIISEEETTTSNNIPSLETDTIFPELTDCTDPIDDRFLTRIASSTCVSNLLQELNAINVFTIGDFAELTKADIIRLPLKLPKVLRVQKALGAYLNNKKREVASVKETREIGTVTPESNYIEDVITRFQTVFRKVQQENVDLSQFFNTVLSNEELAVESFPCNREQISDCRRFLLCVSTMTDRLQIQNVSIIMNHLPNVDVNALVTNLIDTGRNIKLDIPVNRALDSLEHLNLVELGDVTIQRLSSNESDMMRFIEKIFGIAGIDRIVKIVPKEPMLKSFTAKELCDGISEFPLNDIVDSCMYLLDVIHRKSNSTVVHQQMITTLMEKVPSKEVLTLISDRMKSVIERL